MGFKVLKPPLKKIVREWYLKTPVNIIFFSVKLGYCNLWVSEDAGVDHMGGGGCANGLKRF